MAAQNEAENAADAEEVDTVVEEIVDEEDKKEDEE